MHTAAEGWAVPVPLVAPVVLIQLQTRWKIMNEERTGKCFRQVEHIRGYLWHLCILPIWLFSENPCRPNPCSYNGKCVLDGYGGYKCKCVGGYTGSRCESELFCVQISQFTHYLNFKDILSYSVEYHIGGEIISVLA